MTLADRAIKALSNLRHVHAKAAAPARTPDELAHHLRIKFIAMSMAAVVVVLTGIMVTINIVNYANVCQRADSRLGILAANGGAFPRVQSGAYGSDDDEDDTGSGSSSAIDSAEDLVLNATNELLNAFSTHTDPYDNMSVEAPYDARFFTVSLAPDGTVRDVDTGSVAAISTSEASVYGQQLYKRGATKGFLGVYRYLAVCATNGVTGSSTTMYIFLDCSRELSSFQTFLTASAVTAVVALALVLALVVLFSRWVVRPIADSYARQKRFITDASHEIKTPLAVIDAANEVQEIETGESEWTQSIHEQVARLTALTERLVFLSRMDEGAQMFKLADIDLSELVFKVAEPLCSVATARGKHLSLNIDPDIHVKGDTSGLSQLVELLLDNATRYGSDGCNIELRLQSQQRGQRNQAVLMVTNAVDSLPQGNLDKLFERFYRADSSRNSQTGGSGVGLSVAQGIVHAHGGTIGASADDAGSQITFTVRLPRLR